MTSLYSRHARVLTPRSTLSTAATHVTALTTPAVSNPSCPTLTARCQNDPSFDHPSYATDGSMQSGIAAIGSASSEVDSYFNTWHSLGMEAIARLFRHGPAACPPHLSGVGHINPSISTNVVVGFSISVSCLFMPSDNHAALNTSAVARQSSDITSQSSLVGWDTPNSPLHRSQRDTAGHG